MATLHHSMMGTSTAVRDQFDANALLLRQIAGQVIDTVMADKASRFSDDDVMSQAQAWQRDGLLRELRTVFREQQEIDPISTGWVLCTAAAR